MSESASTPSWRWKLVYADKSTFTDLDGPPEASPYWPVFLIQRGDRRPVKLNAGWLMWRRDREKWAVCGEDGLIAHLHLYGHLVGCWRQTLWTFDEDFDALRAKEEKWAWAREEAER